MESSGFPRIRLKAPLDPTSCQLDLLGTHNYIVFITSSCNACLPVPELSSPAYFRIQGGGGSTNLTEEDGGVWTEILVSNIGYTPQPITCCTQLHYSALIINWSQCWAWPQAVVYCLQLQIKKKKLKLFFFLLIKSLHYIILNNGILKSIFNISSERGVYYTVHSLGSIQTNFQWE